MDRAQADRIFTPAAAQALKAFPIEPDGLELVALSENVTFRVTDAPSGDAYVSFVIKDRCHNAGF